MWKSSDSSANMSLRGPMLAFCGHCGLVPAHTKPKQAQCGLVQVRPTALGSLQALCEQPTLCVQVQIEVLT